MTTGDKDDPNAQPPYWQQGEMDILIPVAEDVRSKLGPPGEFFDGENIRLVFRWKVSATRPPTREENMLREMELAIQELEEAEWQLSSPDRATSWLSRNLESALNYALSAWFNSAFHKDCASYEEARNAFLARAPAHASDLVGRAAYGMLSLDPPAFELFEPDSAPCLPDGKEKGRIVADARAAIEALFELIVVSCGRGQTLIEQLRGRAE